MGQRAEQARHGAWHRLSFGREPEKTGLPLLPGIARQRFPSDHFDKRGNGLSDRINGAPTIDERARDIEAVMDAAGLDTAALTAFSEGSALALLFAARNPARISKLVLGSGSAAGRLPSGEMTEAQMQQAREAFLENWGKVGGQHPLATHGPKGDDADTPEEFARFCRLCATPSAIAALHDMNQRFDIRDVLPTIQQPTLVLRRERERYFPRPREVCRRPHPRRDLTGVARRCSPAVSRQC